MKRKRFTEEQIIGVLNEAEQTGNIREICRLNNISRTGRICLIRSVVVSTLLTGGAEKGPSFSYSPPRSSSLKKLSPDSNAFDSASYLTTVFIVLLGGELMALLNPTE
jgi:hypothetical protein